MNAMALGASVLGLVTVLGTWTAFFSTVPRGKVPRRPFGSILLFLTGIGLAIWASVWGFQSGALAGAIATAPAIPAVFLGLLFLFLFSQRKTPIGNLQVKVGDKMLPFEAVTDEGAPFNSSDLAGKRTLLKFYRGGW